jgi:hypothetical protein
VPARRAALAQLRALVSGAEVLPASEVTSLLVEAHRQTRSLLGFRSWREFCEVELVAVRAVPWPRERRQAMSQELVGEGLSARAVSFALGVSHSTVLADVRPGGVRS